MKKSKKIVGIIYLITALTVPMSCKKYLDAKTNKQLVIASSIQDAQALLDNYSQLNIYAIADGNIMDDNFWITDTYFDTRSVNVRNEYTWSNDATADDAVWQLIYKNILTCNTALEVLEKITDLDASNTASYNSAKGMALFMRAYNHFNVVSLFSQQYDPKTSNSLLGIPYKFSSAVSEKVYRPSLEQTYQWIIRDLKDASSLLSRDPAIYPSRPNKIAAFGALARVYLSMADYKNALTYSDSALKGNGQLMNFNSLNLNTTATPFVRFNIEDLYHSTSVQYGALIYPNWNCDSTLYSSYDANDLRKVTYFRKNTNGSSTYSFKGSYDQNTNAGPYGGIANDELYLVRAEGYARTGDVSSAVSDLNFLLKTRWKTNTYIDVPISISQSDALDLILKERRKELILRNNIRWMDIKRLNLESRYAKTLMRIVKGVTYNLPPNDKRFALLIPPTVLSLSGMEQNPR